MTKSSGDMRLPENADFDGLPQINQLKQAQRWVIPMHRNLASGYRLFKRSDLEKFLKQAATPEKPVANRKPR